MAIRIGVADRPWRRLAQLEQRSAMARLVINRVIAGGTVWPRVDLLSLSRIFSTGAISPGDDQARTMSASDAVRAGATYVVVGRPILRAGDPGAAAAEIAATR